MIQQFVNSSTGKEEKWAFSPAAGGGQFPVLSWQSALAKISQNESWAALSDPASPHLGTCTTETRRKDQGCTP